MPHMRILIPLSCPPTQTIGRTNVSWGNRRPTERRAAGLACRRYRGRTGNGTSVGGATSHLRTGGVCRQRHHPLPYTRGGEGDGNPVRRRAARPPGRSSRRQHQDSPNLSRARGLRLPRLQVPRPPGLGAHPQNANFRKIRAKIYKLVMAGEFDRARRAILSWAKAFPKWFNVEISHQQAREAIDDIEDADPSVRQWLLRQAIRERWL
jgi:hypothetical protein